MRLLLPIFLFIISSVTLAQEEVCDEPAQGSEALELASQIEKISEENFSDKFCKAFSACGEFQSKSYKDKQISEIEDHYKTLPEKIVMAKTELEAAKAQLAAAPDAEKEWKQQVVSYAEKKLADLESDKQKYDLHLSDPAKYPHPMKEKGFGLTAEEQAAYNQEQTLKQWGSYYEMIGAQAPVSSTNVWKEIDELAAKSPIDWQNISMKYQSLAFSQTNETDAKIAQAYAADPSKLPELLKEKGIGLKPEEVPAFQKKQAEAYYEGLGTQISGIEKISSILQKKMDELSSGDPNGELPTLAQWKNFYDQQLSPLKELHNKYLAYKANPSSDPDFLSKGMMMGSGGYGGGFGGYGGYGGFGSMGGMVAGSNGGSSSMSDSCSQARSNYQSAVSTMNGYGAGSCGLNEEELSALKYYSDSGYGCLNSYLRSSDNRDENIDYMIQVLNRGLDKLPSYQGVVKRGASLPESIRESHAVGAVLEYDAFTSTSTNSGFSGADMFIIQSQSGKPIMGFSAHRSENEVLFKSGTKFKVLDRTEKDGVFYYIMAEVPDGKKKTPKAESITSLASDVDPNYAPTANADTYLCPVDDKAKIPKVLNQTVVPQFSFPAGAQ